MTTEQLKRVRETARTKETAAEAFEEALREAVQIHTFAQVGRAAGITPQRVAQITGPVGRRPGRGNLNGKG